MFHHSSRRVTKTPSLYAMSHVSAQAQRHSPAVFSWLTFWPPDTWSMPVSCCCSRPDSTHARPTLSIWVCILIPLVQVVTLNSRPWGLSQVYIQLNLLIIMVRPRSNSQDKTQLRFATLLCALNLMLYTNLSCKCQISFCILELKTQPIWRPS